jgi:hypothetical protein
MHFFIAYVMRGLFWVGVFGMFTFVVCWARNLYLLKKVRTQIKHTDSGLLLYKQLATNMFAIRDLYLPNSRWGFLISFFVFINGLWFMLFGPVYV